MKFIANTVSKPVVGKEAAKLTKALKKGEHVANTTALETIARIAKSRVEAIYSGFMNSVRDSRSD